MSNSHRRPEPAQGPLESMLIAFAGDAEIQSVLADAAASTDSSAAARAARTPRHGAGKARQSAAGVVGCSCDDDQRRAIRI